MVDGYNIGARNQHADSGAYEFHIHRAYIIYGTSLALPDLFFKRRALSLLV